MNSRQIPLTTRSFPEPNRLWDDRSQNPTSLGCKGCSEYDRCGGVHNTAGIFDCDDFCNCSDKDSCDKICRNRPDHFVQRVREIKGFELENVSRANLIPISALPRVVTLIDHRYNRNEIFQSDAVAIPLHHMVDFNKQRIHVKSREELADRFLISPTARIILSGVDRDRHIENWWNLKNRERILQDLKTLGVDLITTPNYSVLTDVPRTDNLYAIKRIAITWAEMANAGLPAALHINARTERDYESWTSWIAQRNEVTALAFEFATGCGHPERIDWHITRLCTLADQVTRPLVLVVRGGIGKIHTLARHFSNVMLIETESFSKTRSRQRAWITDQGKLKWSKNPTPKGAPLDTLLAHNAGTIHKVYGKPDRAAHKLRITRPTTRRATHRNDQPSQPSLLDNLHLTGQARPVPSNRHRVIATTKA